MTDDELRALVRRAIARNPAVSGGTAPSRRAEALLAPAQVFRLHPSHGLFGVPAGDEIGGPCVIEPAVACNHCGYCKSYGH